MTSLFLFRCTYSTVRHGLIQFALTTNDDPGLPDVSIRFSILSRSQPKEIRHVIHTRLYSLHGRLCRPHRTFELSVLASTHVVT